MQNTTPTASPAASMEPPADAASTAAPEPQAWPSLLAAWAKGRRLTLSEALRAMLALGAAVGGVGGMLFAAYFVHIGHVPVDSFGSLAALMGMVLFASGILMLGYLALWAVPSGLTAVLSLDKETAQALWPGVCAALNSQPSHPGRAICWAFFYALWVYGSAWLLWSVLILGGSQVSLTATLRDQLAAWHFVALGLAFIWLTWLVRRVYLTWQSAAHRPAAAGATLVFLVRALAKPAGILVLYGLIGLSSTFPMLAILLLLQDSGQLEGANSTAFVAASLLVAGISALAPLATTLLATLQPVGRKMRYVTWAVVAHVAVVLLLPVLTGTSQVLVGKVMEMSGLRQVHTDLLVTSDACATLRAAGVATTPSTDLSGSCWLLDVMVLASVGERHWVSCWRGPAAPEHVKDGFDLRAEEVLRTRRVRASTKPNADHPAYAMTNGPSGTASAPLILKPSICGAVPVGTTQSPVAPASGVGSSTVPRDVSKPQCSELLREGRSCLPWQRVRRKPLD